MVIHIQIPKYVSESDKLALKEAIEKEITKSAIPFTPGDLISVVPMKGISETSITIYGANGEFLNSVKEVIKANHPFYNIDLAELV